ncbi:MAG: hypothetical protein NTY46_12405 [Candidatus Sumerlaeota bacterium]|nr:hypothetical protein [Candidatus Sumerlaeota bacterium]
MPLNARFIHVLIVLCMSVCMMSCRQARLGRLNTSAPAFESPLPALQEGNLSAAQIRERIGARQPSARSLRANIGVIAGIKGAGRQQLQLLLYARLPDQIRARGSQDVGTIFDVMLRGNDARIVIFPERRYYTGGADALRNNPNLLAGMNPLDFLVDLVVDQSLSGRLSENPAPMMTSNREQYVIRFDFVDGSSEIYSVRKRDLLVSARERRVGRRVISRTDYWGYQLLDGGRVAPSRFLTTLGMTGGQAIFQVNELRLNEAPPARIFELQPPPGFEPIALGG